MTSEMACKTVQTAPRLKQERTEIEPHRVLDRADFQLANGAIPAYEGERPPEDIVRGTCPECGGEYVANLYYHTERGYLLRYECWEGLMEDGQCRFFTTPK